MTTSLRSYGPAFALALIIAISAPFMRPVQAEKLHRLNADRTLVVKLEFGQDSSSSSGGFELHGFVVNNASSSAGAMTFPTYPNNTTSASQAMADLYDAGYELVQMDPYGTGCTFVKK